MGHNILFAISLQLTEVKYLRSSREAGSHLNSVLLAAFILVVTVYLYVSNRGYMCVKKNVPCKSYLIGEKESRKNVFDIFISEITDSSLYSF